MPSFFIWHESPQQQHDSLSAEVAWFFMPSFFIWHESPQQQHDSSSDDEASFFIPSCFIISHESPQQPPDMQQHETFLSPPDCVAFCANAAPASARVNPSARAGTPCLRHFILFLLKERLLPASVKTH